MSKKVLGAMVAVTLSASGATAAVVTLPPSSLSEPDYVYSTSSTFFSQSATYTPATARDDVVNATGNGSSSLHGENRVNAISPSLYLDSHIKADPGVYNSVANIYTDHLNFSFEIVSALKTQENLNYSVSTFSSIDPKYTSNGTGTLDLASSFFFVRDASGQYLGSASSGVGFGAFTKSNYDAEKKSGTFLITTNTIYSVELDAYLGNTLNGFFSDNAGGGEQHYTTSVTANLSLSDPLAELVYSPGIGPQVVSGVPEASTWVMALVGFTMLGGFANRRRRSLAKPHFA